MGYERNYRDRNRTTDMDYSRDYGTGRDYGYSSARDYASAGWNDRGDNGRETGRFDQRPYGGYGGRDDDRQTRDYGYGREQGSYGAYGSGRDDYRGYGDYGRGFGGNNDRGNGGGYRQQESGYNRFNQGERYGATRDRARAGYEYDDRGFFARAGDEVRSWFGDEDAERRREMDQRYDERYAAEGDRDYSSWRRSQIDALDRDYDEYRRENQDRFKDEFTSWRSTRQTQRSSLDKVTEHMKVVGSDGQHVGTVDKVRGDKIILTKTDQDAGGHHHSIPSRWIQSVDDKVTISKTADQAKAEWKDVERQNSMFGDQDSNGPHALNRSFSGTYR